MYIQAVAEHDGAISCAPEDYDECKAAYCVHKMQWSHVIFLKIIANFYIRDASKKCRLYIITFGQY